MPASVQIRRVHYTQVEALHRLALATFLEAFTGTTSEANMEAYLAQAFTLEQWQREINNPNSEFYWALAGGEPIGYLELNFAYAQTELCDPESIEIERIYVANQYQGQGIAQRLLQKAIQTAREHRLRYLWLGVWEHNRKALRFYEKEGFAPFGTHAFKMGHDHQTDLLLRRDLE